MKKKIIIISSVILAIVALGVFNMVFSKKKSVNIFAEVRKGLFEITVTNSGELIAEKSLDIMGPEFNQQEKENQNDNHGGGGGGDHGGGGGGGSHGGEFHVMDFKIQDMVPEGTIVKQGDYVAQLDRTSYDNTLKDEIETLKTVRSSMEMKILDTTDVLSTLRDEIKNQKYVVEEARITYDLSKYEPPATKRQAEMEVNKQQRALEQKIKNYKLRDVQTRMEINNQKQNVANQEALVANLQQFLSKFTITAPSPGMVIYKKNRIGIKTKVGSNVNPFDRVIATLPDLTTMISKVYVNEIEVAKVVAGQKAAINIDAFPKNSYTGSVTSVANIGEQLPNSDAKMFEVQIRIDGTDQKLRPSMTTWNKIIIKTIDNAVYIPLECVQTGSDSVAFVYKKNNTRQIVVLGEMNDKNVIVKEGLEPGTDIYTTPPAGAKDFRLVGQNLISGIKQK
jgi:HlyD family secretion protein